MSSYLFVYGSLRSGFKSPAYEYIAPYFDFIANAQAKGLLYDIGEYPLGLPTTKENFIIGELYKLKSENMYEWAFAQLDDYEGIHTEDGETPEFKREIATIYFNSTSVEAWVYWYNFEINDKPIIPSGDVLLYLQNKMSSN